MKILDRIIDYPRQRRIQKIKDEYPVLYRHLFEKEKRD